MANTTGVIETQASAVLTDFSVVVVGIVVVFGVGVGVAVGTGVEVACGRKMSVCAPVQV